MSRSARSVAVFFALSGLTACQSLPNLGAEDIVSACQTYVTVRAVVDLAALIYPSIHAQMAPITGLVDPVCRAVMNGQPTTESAAWVREQTMALEAEAHR